MRTKKYSVIFLLAAMVLWGITPVIAGSERRVGTAGAIELLLPVGSRAIAMNGSLNALIGGIEATHWNPAGLSRIEGTEALFSSYSYIADIKLNYFGIATALGGSSVLAVSVRSMSFGDIPITTVEMPEGTGGYSPQYFTIGLTYSNRFTDRLYGGATVKLINEKIIRTSAMGFAVDLGVQYSSDIGLKLGVTLKNLGPQMKFDGPDLESFASLSDQETGARERALRLPASSFELPSVLEIGVAYEIKLKEDHAIILAGNFLNSNFGSDEFSEGFEYSWRNILFVRAGLMQTQNEDDNIYGPTYGFGVNVPLGSKSSVTLDYAYRSVDYFDGNQWLTVKVGF